MQEEKCLHHTDRVRKKVYEGEYGDESDENSDNRREIAALGSRTRLRSSGSLMLRIHGVFGSVTNALSSGVQYFPFLHLPKKKVR